MSTNLCWTSYRDWLRETYGDDSDEVAASYNHDDRICLLPEGHEGPHEWTPEEEIVVTFKYLNDPA